MPKKFQKKPKIMELFYIFDVTQLQTKQHNNMKKFISAAFLGLFLVAITASCGSSRAHCDAYSDASTTTIEQDDIAQL
jgi:hypothetical protein